MTTAELAGQLLLKLIEKSGVREWESLEARQNITLAAYEMAANITGDFDVALPDSFLDVVGDPWVFADHATDFSPTAANTLEYGTPTDVQLSMASVADDAARQSAKTDLGANRAPAFRLMGAVEMAATPTAGEVISCYWSESHSATAATANPGNVSGSDAAYTGYSSNIGNSVRHLTFIGDFVVTAQATPTVQVNTNIGLLVPRLRYGSLVVFNQSGAAFHSDDVETHFVLVPWLPQVQD